MVHRKIRACPKNSTILESVPIVYTSHL